MIEHCILSPSTRFAVTFSRTAGRIGPASGKLASLISLPCAPTKQNVPCQRNDSPVTLPETRAHLQLLALTLPVDYATIACMPI